MDEEYTLVYYDCVGIGEAIRFIFLAAGVPYKDVRLPFNSELSLPACNENFKRGLYLPAEWKDRVPYGKLPMLLIGNGERNLVSSKPICRYLAAQFGLTAEDPFDDAKCDEYMDSLRDFIDLWRPLYFSKDEDHKASVVHRLKTSVIPRYVGKFDSIIASNNGKNLVGNKITWADVYLAHCLRHFCSTFDQLDFMESYPAVSNLVNHVFSIPAIKDWLEVRPRTSW